MKDYLTGREINIKEAVLVVGNKIYSKNSYISMDTRKLEGFPPKVFYDKNHDFLGKMYDKGVYELEDIEEILIDYSNTCFSNHDLDDLREFLINKRKKLYKSLEKSQ
ncbi:aspartate 1-decarboxylase (aspartate alpha-decarboxylase) [Anaerococcus ihuae]|uniref:aspartate 1-decarboxylase (aspartate alpha-decarboxylase) n=1 Tax=Anaerococcus ihuae TaxID=2899519 RepID=UPI001F43EFDF|nr:aspartate 1-decarboxylase (aspartate alpha-decarboxylase) [Anaerococcus ihuae]